jgi:hypothetical protein
MTPRVLLIDGDKSKGGFVKATARSFTTKDRKYTVTVEPDGSVHCTCPDFEYRHAKHGPHIEDGVACKHVDMFRNNLLEEHTKDV